jgi:hypothetical protein
VVIPRRYQGLLLGQKLEIKGHLQIAKCEIVIRALAGMKCPGLSSRYAATWSSADRRACGHLLWWSSCCWRWSSISPWIIICISHRHIVVAGSPWAVSWGKAVAIIIPWRCLIGVRVSLRGGTSTVGSVPKGTRHRGGVVPIEHFE